MLKSNLWKAHLHWPSDVDWIAQMLVINQYFIQYNFNYLTDIQ